MTLIDPEIAVIVAVTLVVTLTVVIANVADDAPDGTVTEAGTEATPLLEFNRTVAPPDGTGPLNVTEPVAEIPPTTEDGVTATSVKTAGTILKLAVVEPDDIEAVTVTVVAVETAVVPMVKVALD